MTSQSSLSDLLSVKDVVAKYPSIFATEPALRWHIFVNKPLLEQKGVLVYRGRRVFINVAKLNESLQGGSYVSNP